MFSFVMNTCQHVIFPTELFAEGINTRMTMRSGTLWANLLLQAGLSWSGRSWIQSAGFRCWATELNSHLLSDSGPVTPVPAEVHIIRNDVSKSVPQSLVESVLALTLLTLWPRYQKANLCSLCQQNKHHYPATITHITIKGTLITHNFHVE